MVPCKIKKEGWGSCSWLVFPSWRTRNTVSLPLLLATTIAELFWCPVTQRWVVFFHIFAACARADVVSQVPISGISCTLHLARFFNQESVFSQLETTPAWLCVLYLLYTANCAALFPWWTSYFFKNPTRHRLQKQTMQPCLWEWWWDCEWLVKYFKTVEWPLSSPKEMIFMYWRYRLSICASLGEVLRCDNIDSGRVRNNFSSKFYLWEMGGCVANISRR